MTIKTLENVKIDSYEYIGSSVNGNSRYRVTFYNDKIHMTGKCATDAVINLEIYNYKLHDRLANVTYHVTRSGNIIFHQIRKAN